MADDIYLLVSDYDGTFVDTRVPANNGLAPEMVELAKREEKPFSAYYICTARDYRNIETHIGQYLQKSPTRDFFITHTNGETSHANLNAFVNALPCNATRLFTSMTKLPILKFSTPDDLLFDDCVQCGDAYQNYYLPYEQALLASLKENTMVFPKPKTEPGTRPHRAYSKADQLHQIVADAKANFPGKKLHITFVDDLFHQCRYAAEVAESLKDDVEFSIFLMNNSQNKMIPYAEALASRIKEEKESNTINAWKGRLFDMPKAAINAVCQITIFEEQISIGTLNSQLCWQLRKDNLQSLLKDVDCKETIIIKITIDGKIRGQDVLLTFDDIIACDTFLSGVFDERPTLAAESDRKLAK